MVNAIHKGLFVGADFYQPLGLSSHCEEKSLWFFIHISGPFLLGP